MSDVTARWNGCTPRACRAARRWTRTGSRVLARPRAGDRRPACELMHDRLPVDDCPFSWSVPSRLAALSDAARPGCRAALVDRLVVCHGDACAPNTLIADDGQLLRPCRPRRPRRRRPVGRPRGGGVSLGWNYGGAWRHRVASPSTASPPDDERARVLPDAVERRRHLLPLSSTAVAISSRKGISAGHERRARGFPDRHQGRKHPVRPVGQPGVLRVVVPVPRQQRAGLGRPRRRRLPVRLAPAPDHFDPKNLREHVNKDAVVLLPDYPVPDLQRELEKLGFPPVLRDDGLGQTPRQRTQGRSRCDDHRAARPGRRPDRRLRPGGRRRGDGVLQHERRAPH